MKMLGLFSAIFFLSTSGCAALANESGFKKCNDQSLLINFVETERRDIWGFKNHPIGKFSIKNISAVKVRIPIFESDEIPFIYGRNFEWELLDGARWKPAYVVIEELAPPDGKVDFARNEERFLYSPIYSVINDKKRELDQKLRVVVKDDNGCVYASTPFTLNPAQKELK